MTGILHGPKENSAHLIGVMPKRAVAAAAFAMWGGGG
jgi:hypothetical protein